MNRIVLIGNGFDLAHNLKTRYEDFIMWYLEQRKTELTKNCTKVSEDPLFKINILTDTYQTWNLFFYNNPDFLVKSGAEFFNYIRKQDMMFYIEESRFFHKICQSIETKGWVDIENEYYRQLKMYIEETEGDEHIRHSLVSALHKQFAFLRDQLLCYLSLQSTPDKNMTIARKIFSPIREDDIAIANQHQLIKHVENWFGADEDTWAEKLRRYYKEDFSSRYSTALYDAQDYRELFETCPEEFLQRPNSHDFRLPNHIMLLCFNYTYVADLYVKDIVGMPVNHIHGELSSPSTAIFGYGDELDCDFQRILDKNDNSLLCNIKSIRYLESDNYRRMLQFIDSAPFQVYIMGHSCGNSDRTLLNTLFEHRNCVSIKPFYYTWMEKDRNGSEVKRNNYLELVQNISRNFTDMKLMRDRVVNKTFCQELTK